MGNGRKIERAYCVPRWFVPVLLHSSAGRSSKSHALAPHKTSTNRTASSTNNVTRGSPTYTFSPRISERELVCTLLVPCLLYPDVPGYHPVPVDGYAPVHVPVQYGTYCTGYEYTATNRPLVSRRRLLPIHSSYLSFDETSLLPFGVCSKILQLSSSSSSSNDTMSLFTPLTGIIGGSFIGECDVVQSVIVPTVVFCFRKNSHLLFAIFSSHERT